MQQTTESPSRRDAAAGMKVVIIRPLQPIVKRKDKKCRWYSVCPLKSFYEKGLLDRAWIENYCLTANSDCIRRQMEERGLAHSDNMLPDGSIDENLK